MKLKTSSLAVRTKRVSFCSASTQQQSIEIAGEVLVPNEDTAYVEFFLSHAYPVINAYRSAIHPAVVANSFQTLRHKIFNFAHIMRKYDPKSNPRDCILGTVVAVEFTGAKDSWTLTDKENAPGIRGVAVMHKAAQNVVEILTSWFTGEGPYGGDWSVSLENEFQIDDCGFLVRLDGRAANDLEKFIAGTPDNLRALGFVFVPCPEAPEGLLGCLNTETDDVRDKIYSTRICRDFKGQEVILLIGGLDKKLRYRGVGLTPADGAREEEARIARMMASTPLLDVKSVFEPLENFAGKVFQK